MNTQDMTICYDERGAKYELPKFVLSDPSNLARSKSSSRNQQELELAAAAATAEAAVPSFAETMVR
jgi:Ubiquitin-binding domain